MRNLSLVLAVASLGLALGLGSVACSSSEKTPEQTPVTPEPTAPVQEEPSTPAVEEEKAEVFGAKLNANLELTAFEEITANPDQYKDKTIATEGVVRENCEKRGCWMAVRPAADRNGETIMIRFKDYKFFVPLDSRGAKVRMNGKLTVTLYTPEQVAELEAEGGSVSNKLPDGSAKVTLFIATGVEMRGRKGAKK